METKERAYARLLINKFTDNGMRNWSRARQCAIICATELINNSSSGCNECGGNGNWHTDELKTIMNEIKKL